MERDFVVKQQEKEITRLILEKKQAIDALREIEAITRGLGEFNPTYEKIHKIASEALGKEDERNGKSKSYT